MPDKELIWCLADEQIANHDKHSQVFYKLDNS